MPTPQNNRTVKLLKILTAKKSISILEVLQTMGSLQYSVIMKIIYGGDMNRTTSSRFAYYIRKLKRNKLIMCDILTHTWRLTEQGIKVLEFYKAIEPKYITEEKESICQNSVTDEHDYVQLCRRCGYLNIGVKVVPPKRPQRLELKA